MSQLEHEKLYKEWQKGHFDPVYFFHGEEDFIIDELCARLTATAIQAEEKDFNLDILWGNENDGAQIVNIASSYPMMAERRLVFVKNCHLLSTTDQELLLKYVKNPSATTCLVLTAAKLESKRGPLGHIRGKAVAYEAKKLYDNKIPDWIRHELAKKQIGISNDAVRLLQASAGNSLRALSSELNKILLNLQDRKSIQAQDVEKVVGTSKQYNIFELCDTIGRRDLAASLHILSEILQMGDSPVSILSLITRHFTILAKVKELKSKRLPETEMAKTLSVHPYFVKNYSQQAFNFSRLQLQRVFEMLLEADYALKSSYQKPRMILELLLFKINNDMADRTAA